MTWCLNADRLSCLITLSGLAFDGLCVLKVASGQLGTGVFVIDLVC